MEEQELLHLTLPGYMLGSSLCHQNLQKGGVYAHLNTIERYYIYAEFTKNNHLNDEHNISPNKIFDALLEPHQP